MVFKVKNPSICLNITKLSHIKEKQNQSHYVKQKDWSCVCLTPNCFLINLLQDQGSMTQKADCVTVTVQEQVWSNTISELSNYPKFQAKNVI